jgi:hypothetical protein
MQLMILFLGMLVAAIPFVLLSARNTRFFCHRLAAHAAGLEAYVANYRSNLNLLNEYERQKREAQKLSHNQLRQAADKAGLTLTQAGRVQ